MGKPIIPDQFIIDTGFLNRQINLNGTSEDIVSGLYRHIDWIDDCIIKICNLSEVKCRQYLPVWEWLRRRRVITQMILADRDILN